METTVYHTNLAKKYKSKDRLTSIIIIILLLLLIISGDYWLAFEPSVLMIMGLFYYYSSNIRVSHVFQVAKLM